MQVHSISSRADVIALLKSINLFCLSTVDGLLRLLRSLAMSMSPRLGARYDPLTGLLNRGGLESKITELKSSPQDERFAVLFLDLDRFSRVNDSTNRQTGDCLLQQVSTRLKGLLLDQADGAIARLESDEFILLVAQEDVSLTDFAQRLLQSFSAPFRVDRQTFYLTASLGIAESHLPGRSGADYIQHAQAALLAAKQSGPGHYRYSTAVLSASLADRWQLEADLRCALAQQQLLVYYQPIINGQTQALSGFEALLRWQHPQRGMISPAEFIPIAEQSGQILEIGWWVMTQACAQMAAWQQQFPECSSLTISVNMASQQLLHPDCSQRIREILKNTQLPPQCLTLEMTESAFIEHHETTQATLAWIASQRIGLSIDDFGTGYSSLSYLYRFPVSTVKIDQSFIQAAALACNSGAIVEAIIALGHTLGLQVVAEGVETLEAMNWLKAHHCHHLQGFLFSRPVTAAAATALLQA